MLISIAVGVGVAGGSVTVGVPGRLKGAVEGGGGGQCTTAMDCHLGGHCTAKACVCSDEWTGPYCELLALLPAKLDSGFRPPEASSWGGKIVAVPAVAKNAALNNGTMHVDGGDAASNDDAAVVSTYHLFAARFTNHCGLSSWTHNSEVVHAVSSSPTGQ